MALAGGSLFALGSLARSRNGPVELPDQAFRAARWTRSVTASAWLPLEAGFGANARPLGDGQFGWTCEGNHATVRIASEGLRFDAEDLRPSPWQWLEASLYGVGQIRAAKRACIVRPLVAREISIAVKRRLGSLSFALRSITS
jgi:hypothetical protein